MKYHSILTLLTMCGFKNAIATSTSINKKCHCRNDVVSSKIITADKKPPQKTMNADTPCVHSQKKTYSPLQAVPTPTPHYKTITRNDKTRSGGKNTGPMIISSRPINHAFLVLKPLEPNFLNGWLCRFGFGLCSVGGDDHLALLDIRGLPLLELR